MNKKNPVFGFHMKKRNFFLLECKRKLMESLVESRVRLKVPVGLFSVESPAAPMKHVGPFNSKKINWKMISAPAHCLNCLNKAKRGEAAALQIANASW